MEQENQMVIRRLTEQDAEIGVQAIRLLKSIDGYPIPSPLYLSSFLSRLNNVFVVAFDGASPVGYVAAYLLDRIDRDQRMALLYDIGVAEPMRGRGVGTGLVTELKRICSGEGAMKMWVHTSRSNVAATRLYETTGGVPQPPGEGNVIYEYAESNLGGGAEGKG
jgi:ribosomal protein S18 acetylase RimI-like enzyme